MLRLLSLYDDDDNDTPNSTDDNNSSSDGSTFSVGLYVGIPVAAVSLMLIFFLARACLIRAALRRSRMSTMTTTYSSLNSTPVVTVTAAAPVPAPSARAAYAPFPGRAATPAPAPVPAQPYAYPVYTTATRIAGATNTVYGGQDPALYGQFAPSDETSWEQPGVATTKVTLAPFYGSSAPPADGVSGQLYGQYP